jgi:hypothetical protein
MNWKLVIKDRKNQPASGEYSDWKEQVAEECYHQCVYCAIPEGPWGGIDHYHIDHYRPKSKKEFEHLKDDICNLFYACPVCNRFKHDDWPGEPVDLNRICYPDPSQVDYSVLFELSDLYTLSSPYVAGVYLIERLYLNRPQLIYERRESSLKERQIELMAEVRQLLRKVDDKDVSSQAIDLFGEISAHLVKRDAILPYKLSEIRKP